MPFVARRRLFLAAPLVLASLSAGCASDDALPPASCFEEVSTGFAKVQNASLLRLERCFAADGLGSISACIGNADDLVGAARRDALAAEASACGSGSTIGYAGAGDAAIAAEASAAELGRGLFGLDLDGARIPRSQNARAALCQEAVLTAAGACATEFVRQYRMCAFDVAARAMDAFDLVACKREDRDGSLLGLCGGAIDAATTTCDGLDGAPLFPGCAGDIAACARGQARRSSSLALNEAHALCKGVRPGSLDEEQLLRCFEPPVPEPIVMSDVALPAGVNAVTVEWDDTGARLLLGFNSEEVDGTQLAIADADGANFRCLTCASAITGNLRPVQQFQDHRRVLVAGPNNANPSWSILECTPSLLDCRSSVLVPIQLPPNPDPTTRILQYRVPWVTLDDAWLVWSEVRLRGPGGNLSAMGRLTREQDHYAVTGARVIAPPPSALDPGDDSDRWRNLTQPLEAKFGALRGGLDWVEAGTPDAGHYDTSVIDLTDGTIRRLTHHPDHDEGVRFSRDEKWAVLQSGRTDNRTEFLGLVPRPPYIDWIAFSVHFVGIAGAPNDGISPGSAAKERDCYVDPWLLDRWFERGAYIGQRLEKPADGWASIEGNAGGFGWAPDGARIALIERRWRRLGSGEETRLRIASLPSRKPISAADVVPLVSTPDPTWATPYEAWIVPDTTGVSVVPGKVSGTATIRNAMPTTVQGEVEVVYDDYSDDGESVLDGYERLRIPQLIVNGAEYEVDLVLRGRHTGSMRGMISYDFVNDVNTGEVVSELDGRVLRGPKSCYESGLLPVP